MKILEIYFKKTKGIVPNYARYPLWLILVKPIRKWLNVTIVPNIPFNKLRVFSIK